MEITRKEFIRLTVTFLGVGLGGGAAAACSSSSTPSGTGSTTGTDSGAPTNGATCASNGAKNGTISSNHGHSLLVPAADFATPQDKTYDIKGTATHTHAITITAAQFGELSKGTSITTTSTVGEQHTHDVQVICA